MKSSSVTVQTKATEQYFPVALKSTLCKVALTFESVDKIWSVTNKTRTNESFTVALFIMP